MPESTPTTFNAFGLPLALEAYDQSTAGQAGPRAGIPTPETNDLGEKPLLVLGAQGEQTSTTTIMVETTRGGNIGYASGIWTQEVSGSSVEDYRGADLPVVMQGFSPVTWAVSGSQMYPHTINLPDGSQLMAVAYRPAVTTWSIRVYPYDPTTDTYGSPATVRSGLDADHAAWPWLMLLPSGRILCFYWVADDTAGLANIEISYSDDYGATWSVYAELVLQSENVGLTNVTLNRITACLVQEQMILCFHLTDTTDGEQVWQWRSADYGATFTFLGVRTDYAYPVLNVIANAAYMHYLSWTGAGTAKVYIVPITAVSLFDPTTASDLSAVMNMRVGTVTDSGGGIFILTRGDLAASVEDSWLWCWVIDTSGTEQRGIAGRVNSQTMEITPTNEFGFWWYDGRVTTTEYPMNYSATFYRRQVRIYGNVQSATTTYEDHVSRWDLGGYATVTMPLTSAIPQINNYATWYSHYIPTRVPSGYDWTHTGAGTQDITTAPGWLYNSTAANTCYDTLTLPAVASDEGTAWLFRLKQVSGGAVTSTVIGATIEVASALIRYKAALQVSSTQLRIRDVHGAADRGTIAIDTTAGVDVMVWVNFGKVSAFARLSEGAWDRKWTEICNGSTLTDGGAGGADEVVFGNISSGTAVSQWQIVNGASGGWLGTGSTLADGFTNPDDLHAFIYLFGPSYLTAGVSITAQQGPAFPGDAYTIYPFADFPICYAVPRGSTSSRAEIQGGQQPSPQVETRSLATSTWALGAGYWRWNYPTSGDRYIPPILICHVVGANFPTALIRTHVAGGASTSRGTMNFCEGAEGLAFLRDGNTVKCDTGTASTDNPFFENGQLAGGYLWFTATDDIRPIVDNGAGNWTNDGTGQGPWIEIEGDDAEPASGVCSVIWPEATFVLYTDGTLACEGFELAWTSEPPTYEGYVKVGAVAWCEGIALYEMPSWSDARDADPAAEVFASQFGADRPRQTGVLRAIRELPFTSTYSNQRLIASTATVGARVYFRATSSSNYPIVAASDDTATKMHGLWSQTKGGAIPVVHVGRMVRGTPNTYTLTGYDAGFLGTLATNTPRFTATVGWERGGNYTRGEVGASWILRALR